MNQLSHLYSEINTARNELYSALEAQQNLCHHEVCKLSCKLDKLIVEFQTKYCLGQYK